MEKNKAFSKHSNNISTAHQIRVRFNETDAMNVVWHGNYMTYFEDGREAFGREHGLTYLDVKKNGFSAPIVKTSTEHKLPLTYGDLATIETTFINSRAAKLMFSYIIKNEKGNVVCKGETTQVFTSSKGGLSLITPEFFKSWKLKLGLLDD